MKQEKELSELLSDALSKDLLFASFRYPERDEVHFICQTNSNIRAVNEVDRASESGFILQDFNSEKSIWIDADIHRTDFQKNIPLPLALQYSVAFEADLIEPISKSDYLAEVSGLISEIQKGKSSKVVFSRTIHTPLQEQQLPLTFLSLLDKYKDAFVFLVHLPGGISWIGASPETLISNRNGEVNTMALAGTRKARDFNWTNKEKDEQAYVADFIEAKLNESNISFRKSELHEKILSSGIMHLCNEYSFNLDGLEQIWEIVQKLHPTPAVCGIPLKKALELIRKTEKHRRSFYTGYLGSVNIENETNLFVNLRSAQVHDNMACIYLGGGITSESLPEAEWEETKLKSRTLLDALEGRDKMQIFSA